MHTITFFAPKGGSGRTTVVMATASAFIEAGHRVGVIDTTEEARRWPPSGQSFIRQWQTSMLTSGIGPDQLVTASAWDFDSFYSAKKELLTAGCTHILIDTPKAPNKLIEYVLLECDLIVMPFSGYFEATWISSWVTSNLCPVRKMFGLATGLMGTEEHQAIHRQALYGSPMLKSSLPRSYVFANQLIDGSFYKLEAGSDTFGYTDADLLHARSAATKLIKELNRLVKTRSFSRYQCGEQLATGHPLAHLQALHAQAPEAFC
ncbi:division plane positioning ATPase MipZ [Roseinatronobacter monicus]|uniref:Cellulose biosynthesis protein BcsQ n=1 Tax=Roseinatronobacter monicus TaxID=393481 RepID=A0A543KEW0_9RHOB|nr:division plane positioning ATPase MipZ [Roseinatronobacter monicus]TQM93620.1 cellulose biosynthesis protein BcsQ [Roseinatronobacter monicus]